jgi:hypothetical protein
MAHTHGPLNMTHSRRDFLCRCCTSLGAAALTFERFGLVNALAQSGDYRALVCIFLFGGNDSDNIRSSSNGGDGGANLSRQSVDDFSTERGRPVRTASEHDGDP